MKQRVLFLLFITSFILLAGCGAKKRPEAHLAGSSGTAGANPIHSESLQNDFSSEEDFGWGEEESLANSGRGLSPEEQSDAYKEKYGRSTAPLYPVYFPFDSSEIHQTQLQNINDDVNYLLENSEIKVVIEGNTDNRGTREYNMALGERRAQSVKRYLIENGVEPSRLSTLSFGALRPLFHGNTEEAWARNRRADLVIQ